MLAQGVVDRYAGRARFVVENFGESGLAARFGVDRYPAVFVDEVLVARPSDFGFFGRGQSSGRYAPWKNAQNQARFQTDLARMIEMALAGKTPEPAAAGRPNDSLDRLPEFSVADLGGEKWTRAGLQGRVVVVEFWATWCPPCRSTLEWLGKLKSKYGDRLEVLAFAVESPEDKVRELSRSLKSGVRYAIADAPTAAAFKDVVAIPTLYVFGPDGTLADSSFGAPPDLHERLEKKLAGLLP